MELAQEFIEQRYQLLDTIVLLGNLLPLFFVLGVLVLLYIKKRLWQLIVCFMLLGMCIGMYAMYVERYWLKVATLELERGWDTRVVLIADQHLGVFKGGEYMRTVVETINNLKDVDFVVIAGDLTYWPKDLEQEHQALGNLNVPAYAVLGNHDVQQSGVISHEKELEELLPSLGVTVLHNEIVTTDSGVTIYGLGNHWSHTDDVGLLANANPQEEHILILTHNPDTTSQNYPDVDLSDSVTMTGHTHCGQIRIPWLYKHVIPTERYFPDHGPYDLQEKGTLLITCGLGEVGLPLRLFNRPEIMMVDL